MAAGRCAGCGAVNSSCKVIRSHINNCPDYLELFKTNPAACLDPETEHARWKLEEAAQENDTMKAERRANRRKSMNDRRAKAQERWAKKPTDQQAASETVPPDVESLIE